MRPASRQRLEVTVRRGVCVSCVVGASTVARVSVLVVKSILLQDNTNATRIHVHGFSVLYERALSPLVRHDPYNCSATSALILQLKFDRALQAIIRHALALRVGQLHLVLMEPPIHQRAEPYTHLADEIIRGEAISIPHLYP